MRFIDQHDDVRAIRKFGECAAGIGSELLYGREDDASDIPVQTRFQGNSFFLKPLFKKTVIFLPSIKVKQKFFFLY